MQKTKILHKQLRKYNNFNILLNVFNNERNNDSRLKTRKLQNSPSASFRCFPRPVAVFSETCFSCDHPPLLFSIIQAFYFKKSIIRSVLFFLFSPEYTKLLILSRGFHTVNNKQRHGNQITESWWNSRTWSDSCWNEPTHPLHITSSCFQVTKCLWFSGL